MRILPVNVVAVNFYPFEAKVAEKRPVEEIIENIDVGGPTMLRAAAKNFQHVLPVVDPRDYSVVLGKIDEGIDLATRLYLAVKAFRSSARYESAIAAYTSQLQAKNGTIRLEEVESTFPANLSLAFEKMQDLRYGENPHQRAAFYRESVGVPMAVSGARKHQGKELSYNNLLDLDSAWRLICEFDQTAAAVIKHTNPCGAALGSSPLEAYLRAREGDPVSAFGGIVSFNRPVDVAAAKELAGTFLEAVIAPAFESDALEVLSAKKNLRVLSVDDPSRSNWGSFNMCRIVGGLLVQEWDLGSEDSKLEVVTERKPSDEEMEALQFSWKVVKHIKSNAILVARKDRTLGVGAGQMSRVDSCELAIKKSNESLEGTVAASDAFFPFRDGLDVLADAGVTAIIQPGGSIRDEEVVTAANERGVAMVFTGTRHFKH